MRLSLGIHFFLKLANSNLVVVRIRSSTPNLFWLVTAQLLMCQLLIIFQQRTWNNTWTYEKNNHLLQKHLKVLSVQTIESSWTKNFKGVNSLHCFELLRLYVPNCYDPWVFLNELSGNRYQSVKLSWLSMKVSFVIIAKDFKENYWGVKRNFITFTTSQVDGEVYV